MLIVNKGDTTEMCVWTHHICEVVFWQFGCDRIKSAQVVFELNQQLSYLYMEAASTWSIFTKKHVI